jgi:hypothetical protein
MTRAAALALLFLAACRATTSAQPASGERSLVRTESTLVDAGAKPEVSASEAPHATTPDVADAIDVKDWFCFSWVHGRDFASPCFEAKPACIRAQQDDTHHDKLPCGAYSGVLFCSPPAQASARRSCFQEPLRVR